MTAQPASALPLIGAAHFSFSQVAGADLARCAKAVGTQAVRLEVPWQDMEVRPGQYAMSPPVADKLAALKAAGIPPLLLLTYGNGNHTAGWANPPTTLAGCQAYARAAAWLGQQVPEAWGIEIENEPNVPEFWNDAPAPEQYAQLLSAALPVIHAAAPKLRLLTAGVGGCGGSWGDCGLYMAAVLKAADSAAIKLLHSIAIHPYDRRASAALLFDFINTFRAKTGWTGWLSISEWGVEDDWIDGDQTKRAIFEANMPLFAAWAGVKALTTYSLIDSGTDLTFGQMAYGLFKSDLTPKPAAAARKAVMDAWAGCVIYEFSRPSQGVMQMVAHKIAGDTTITWSADGSTIPVIVNSA